MIRHLSITNYVLIDRLEVELGSGFNIITGETGSGKSILLGALALAMGERADSKTLLDSSKKCIVELEVDLSGLGLEALFAKHDLDHLALSVLRRQIDPQGRSRAFVNDVPVRLEVLKTISERIVHVHSQHKNALISSKTFQFDLLDHLAGADAAKYAALYKEWRSLNKHLEELKAQDKNGSIDQDYFRFQLKELEAAELREGEQEELEERISTLQHADELRTLSEMVASGSALELLSNIKERLGRSAHLSSPLAELNERFDSAFLELKDVLADLEGEVSEVEMDPAEQARLLQRSDLINGLLHKHRVGSITQVLALKEELEKKLSGLNSLEDEIGNLELKLNALKVELKKCAEVLSSKRKKAAPKVAGMVEEQLRELGMPSAMFKVELAPRQDPGPNGIDELTLAFSANKGIAPQPLGKVASGGELSRIMLSMISLLTDAQGLPAVIFDEIDSGVSGDVAARVGTCMKRMAQNMQVLCITHLPQIAGKADTHFKVLREEDTSSTRTVLKSLNEVERVQEIAQMLSGTTIGEAAMENARALIG